MSNGSFSGNPKTEWLDEPGGDRNMRLLANFYYDDPDGRRWNAGEGSVINGASIPVPLWSTVGSPYTGDYRRASVVHDVACATAGVDRKQADQMFYFACLAGGCSLLQAKLLYAGVRIGAWAGAVIPFEAELAMARPDGTRLPGELTPQELEVRAKYTLIAQDLRATSDDFDAIRAVVDAHLNPVLNKRPSSTPGNKPTPPHR